MKPGMYLYKKTGKMLIINSSELNEIFEPKIGKWFYIIFPTEAFDSKKFKLVWEF